MYRDSAAEFLSLQGFCGNPGIPPQIPQKGDYTHLVEFLRLVACRRLFSLEGAPAGVWEVC